MAGRPRAFATVEELQRGIDAYFDNPGTIDVVIKGEGLIGVNEPLSVSALADSLGICRDTLHEYAKGAYGEEFSDAIKKAVIKIERDKVSKAMIGMYNRTIAIFDLKNNHGWKDQKDVKADVDMRTGAYELSDEQLARIAAGSG